MISDGLRVLGGLHAVTWGGTDLDVLEDHFTTRSGKKALLQIYVERGKLDQAHFAMQSLKKAMKWDEDVFGLELDLDQYMIVAVGDFRRSPSRARRLIRRRRDGALT